MEQDDSQSERSIDSKEMTEWKNDMNGSRKHVIQPSYQDNMHIGDPFVNLDDLIECTVLHHEIHGTVRDTNLIKMTVTQWILC
jgi:hypothetical protein